MQYILTFFPPLQNAQKGIIAKLYGQEVETGCMGVSDVVLPLGVIKTKILTAGGFHHLTLVLYFVVKLLLKTFSRSDKNQPFQHRFALPSKVELKFHVMNQKNVKNLI